MRAQHTDCEDCWYSCATLTCNDDRKSDTCDCGADETNAEFVRLEARIAALEAENARLREELEDASPMTECARCGEKFRLHSMVIEEGDEWECQPCNARCNAGERKDAQR